MGTESAVLSGDGPPADAGDATLAGESTMEVVASFGMAGDVPGALSGEPTLWKLGPAEPCLRRRERKQVGLT